ncbi:MAG: hypothetical protein Ct9H300mP32_3280 [Verrucomicrobiota bacterium]|nr:MAG: hypothetical protein Ct9H300mP32_3280 [Verrucomicrobiota bacterium]
MHNQIDVYSKAFLGMTLGCARCHDHKFDAISTRDYYAFAATSEFRLPLEGCLRPGRANCRP